MLNSINYARRRRTKFETLRPQALKGSLLYQIFVINQAVFEIYKFRILPAAGAYDKHHDEDTTKHPQFETLRPQALKGSLLHQICVMKPIDFGSIQIPDFAGRRRISQT